VLAARPEAPPASKQQLIAQGIAAADQALGVDPQSAAARSIKADFVGARADLEPDFPRKIALLKQADALQGVPPMTPAFEADLLRLTPQRIGGPIPAPKKIVNAAPVYPAIAQSARVQGTIVIETIVDDAGRVAAARVLRSIPLLDEAAVATVRRWQFEPTRVDGRAVAIVMRVTVAFALQDF
jgi:TonB family protein